MGDGKCYRLAVNCLIGFFNFPLREFEGVMAVASMVCDLDREVVTTKRCFERFSGCRVRSIALRWADVVVKWVCLSVFRRFRFVSFTSFAIVAIYIPIKYYGY